MDIVNIYSRTGPRGVAQAFLGHDGQLYTKLVGFPSSVRKVESEAEARTSVDMIYEASCA